MNRIYRLVWNCTLNAWVAVSENAKGRGKSTVSGRKLIALAVAAVIVPMAANAAPLDGVITSGTGTIAQAGAVTNITQSTSKLSINWQDFGIATGETVNFLQPSAMSIALNRVVGQNPSQIFGNLNANGQVFVLNPNGVLFGAGAQVNVGGLVASTLNLTDADFNAGRFTFSNGGVVGSGVVDNQGALNAANGGYIALISTNVTNTGSINAQQGMAALAAGNTVTLNLNNGSLLGYTIDAGTASALINNGGLISANGGQVLITAQGADALSTAVVNNTGVIEAQTVQNVGGVIKLMADMTVGQVNVNGTLDASAPTDGDGGFVETSAATVNVADTASVVTASTLGTAGNWLIDPVDYIIGTGGNMSGTALSASLTGGNVTIQTGGAAAGNGDIFVNDIVAWSTNKLTFNSHRNININANLNGSGAASLALNYGQGAVAAGNNSGYFVRAAVNLPAGPNFRTKLGSDGMVKNYTVITSLGAPGSTTATDLQGMNGNLAGNYALGADIDASATSRWNGGAGFSPIGYPVQQTVFLFNGRFDGLGHVISRLTINRALRYDNIYGYREGHAGVGLFGSTGLDSIIQNVGLIGASVRGSRSVGVIAGNNEGVVRNSYATGSVMGNWCVGGLVGLNAGGGSIMWSSGKITTIGIGYITNSYFSGNVTDNGYLNGIAPNGDDVRYGIFGGLVGANNGNISHSYSDGTVSNQWGGYTGGLVGVKGGGIVSNSYWNTTTSGRATSAGGIGLTTAQMKQQSIFTGFDFTNTWRIYDGHTAPLLKSFLKPLTVTANSITKIYDGQTTDVSGVSYSSTPNANLLGTLGYGGAANAGSYSMGGLYSNQQGYDISYVAGTLTIDPAVLNLSVAADPQTKVYGSLDPVFTFAASGFANGDNGATILTGALSRIAGENVGAYAITQGTLAANSNYTINYTGADLTITPATLNIVANALTKVYGSADPALSHSVSGFQFTDSEANVLTGGLTRATGKNVGSYAIAQGSLTSNGNYTIQYTGANLDITPYAMTIAAVAQNKTYDVTTGATVALINNGFAGDDLSTSFAAASFADKNAGAGKVVTVEGITLAGADAGNYSFNTVASTTADIAKFVMTVTAAGENKVYDTTTRATVVLSNNGFAGDDLSISYAANFSDKNAGIGKVVSVRGITLGGTDAGNYTFNAAASTTADITKANLTIAAAAQNKVYDTTTDATIALSNNGFIGDDLSTGFAIANFADKNAGTGKVVTVDGITLGGMDAGNYTFNTTAVTTADITKAYLSIAAISGNKVYDGTTNATVALINDAFTGDDLSTSYAAANFAGKNAGTGKLVTVEGITLSGVDAGNYSFSSIATTTADIIARALLISATGVNKIFDHTTDATVIYSDDRIAGDTFTVYGTAMYDAAHVGFDMSISVTDIGLSGIDALNYTFNATTETSANIAPPVKNIAKLSSTWVWR